MGSMFFDRVAATYEGARPPYPPALYVRLRELGVLRPDVRVLEVGAGTGEATGAFVEAGARVMALEPAPAMAARLQQRFPDLEAVVSTLEDAELTDDSFDVATSATAFHWVDPDVGLPKVHRALTSEGLLVVWRTVYGDPYVQTGFRERVAEITSRRPSPETGRIDPLDVDGWMRTLTAGGLFEPIEAIHLRWQIELTAEQIRSLFGTFSDWSSSEVEQAAKAVADLGGSVTEHYVTVLAACRAVKDR